MAARFLVVESGGYSLVVVASLTVGQEAPGCIGFSSCGSQALQGGLDSCGM